MPCAMLLYRPCVRASFRLSQIHSWYCVKTTSYKNSSGDEIANVNFFLQHRTCRGQRLRPLNEFVISTKHLRYLPTHQTDFKNGLARPTRFAPQMDAPIAKLTRNSSGDMGVGNYSLNSRHLLLFCPNTR